jgi:acyl carrier protein
MSSGDTSLAGENGLPSRRVSASEIQDWLSQYLARALEIPADDVDTEAPFESFALDSATALGMTGDLEQWLGRRVDPTVVYDYPTIEEISAYLANDS